MNLVSNNVRISTNRLNSIINFDFIKKAYQTFIESAQKTRCCQKLHWLLRTLNLNIENKITTLGRGDCGSNTVKIKKYRLEFRWKVHRHVEKGFISKAEKFFGFSENWLSLFFFDPTGKRWSQKFWNPSYVTAYGVYEYSHCECKSMSK